MKVNLQQSIARALLEISAVGFSPDFPITFTSGIKSPVYVDNRILVFHPAQWQLVINGFRNYIDSMGLKFDVIAGVAEGGVPHSSALAFILESPSVFIRKEAKSHGKRRRIEGGDVAGKRVLLVEDHITTGGSSIDAVLELREAGANVSDVLAIISYRFPDAAAKFDQEKLNLHTLTEFDVLLDSALSCSLLESRHLPVIQDWFRDPHTWGKQYA